MRLGSSLLASLLLTGSVASFTVAEEPRQAVDEPLRQTIQGNDACLRLDQAMDYQVIDSRTVIVWRHNRKEAYKIGLFQGCSRLRSAGAIHFDNDRWGQLCGRGGEYLVVARHGIPLPQRPFDDRRGFSTTERDVIKDRCAVASVQLINDDVVHELLVQGGHAQPRGPERADRLEVLAAEGKPSDEKTQLK